MDNSAALSPTPEIQIVPPPVGPTTLPIPTGIPDLYHEMYKAVIEGDVAATEALMGRDNSLAWRELTEEGDKALHLAIANNHAELAAGLMARLGADQVIAHDGRGYTACCYAAKGGMVELVRSMVEAHPTLLKLQSWYEMDPCALAVANGRIEVVSYFLTLDDALTEADWLQMLMIAIEAKSFDVGLTILEKKGSLAEMKCDGELTPVHVLARSDVSTGFIAVDEPKMQSDLKLLVEKLWENIQHLGRDRVVELITNPPLLHDAIKLGNLHLVTMVLRGYPYLLFRSDLDGHTLLHTIITSRRHNMLPLVQRAKEYVNNFNCLDKDNNNLLHYAGKRAEQDVDLKGAHDWYMAVEAVVPPKYKEMRNKKGDIPEDLFWKEHTELLAKNGEYMKKRAESSMIVSTVLLASVFAAAFAPPGGYDQVTGIPLLLHENAFKIFMMCELVAFCSAGASTVGFLYIISSKRREYYRAFVMPYLLRSSIYILMVTVISATCAFLSSFYLEFIKKSSTRVSMGVWVLVELFFLFGFLFWFNKQLLKHVFRPVTPWVRIKFRWKIWR